MRVTTVVPLYPPGSRVGAWLATHELLRGLVARGHVVEVVPTFGPARPYRIDGVTVLPSARRDRSIDQADVVVSHLGDNGDAHRIAVAARIPSVRMVHGAVTDLRLLRGAALAIANSHATAGTLSHWTGRVEVVHPPTDPEDFATTPGDRITLVNLSAEKGGEVFWRLAHHMPDLRFLGVQGGYGGQLLGQRPNVEVLAPTGNMRDDVYRRTRVLLMPSRAETWGMTGIEAACSGIPVLARPTPGLRESLGIAGNWVDSYGTGAWVSALRQLLEPDAWEEASQRALARSGEFDPARQRGRFAAVIESLATVSA